MAEFTAAAKHHKDEVQNQEEAAVALSPPRQASTTSHDNAARAEITKWQMREDAAFAQESKVPKMSARLQAAAEDAAEAELGGTRSRSTSKAREEEMKPETTPSEAVTDLVEQSESLTITSEDVTPHR